MELRPGYKRTEIGVIPNDWEVHLISDVALTSSGTTPARASADRYFKNGTIPWIKTLDLNNAEIVETEECITKLALAETSLKLFPQGTVLVAMYGGYVQIGRTGLLRISATVNQAITAIIPDNKKLHSAYLLYTLNYRVNYWKSVASSSRKDPNITGNDVKAFPITMPSTSEQLAIATALSDIDAFIEGLSKLITKKRDIKQATMQQLLTGKTRLPGFSKDWETKRLGDHVVFLKNGVNSRAELSNTGKTKYLHYGDIHSTSTVFLNVQLTTMPFLSEDRARRIDRLQNGDLVFVDASEDLDGVGKCVEIIDSGSGATVAGLHTIAARFDKSVLADRFKAYLQFCPVFKNNLHKLAVGTKVFSTSRTHISSVEMKLPDTDEQTAIAQVLSDMDNEIAALEKRLEKTRLIKQGMMQELLTGRIRLV